MSTDTIPFKSGGHPERDARLVKAAVRVDDVVYVGWRHATIMNDQLPRTRIDQDQQGFVDQYGNFYNRYRSARIALRAEQIKGGYMNEPKWRSTKKDPPKIKEVVIISDGRSVTAGYRASSDREDYQYLDEDGANTCFIIPHVWMPLPSAKTVPKYVVDA